MNTYFDMHFNRDIVIIYPGEFYTTKKDEIISTVLGSCVAIALFDTKKQFGGMNHFMLAKDSKLTAGTADLMGRFGEYALELLINDMLKNGSMKKDLTAKVFGGSNVLNFPPAAGPQVGDLNIKFAFDYLQQENIPVTTSDTGGIEPRKIFYEPETAKIWLKRIHTNVPDVQTIISQEEKYLQTLKDKTKQAGTVVWF